MPQNTSAHLRIAWLALVREGPVSKLDFHEQVVPWKKDVAAKNPGVGVEEQTASIAEEHSTQELVLRKLAASRRQAKNKATAESLKHRRLCTLQRLRWMAFKAIVCAFKVHPQPKSPVCPHNAA
eukprot:1156964-Pelagomonas_calceolata.AAC.2